ncbi:hypothetical protein [Corallococcus terminator]|uniref:DUF2326 domain-containing protein n=1 Tax=Corallococcus terminator TaxID=2316733 RepID=A0A3A8IWY0_9BACT|nr:hypothetical protein [Corallococcus terminator]RKG87106.1 hypothetical protein D7V88_16695 [Corallococcus terminator]
MPRKQDRKTLDLQWPAPDLKPGAGLAEPRLWVQRLRLWHDFADDDPAHGRNIEFRRGLNIVSSPAGPTAEQVSTGHAAGKTLLCRQIRYCLGEDTYADPEDTAAIRARFPNGGVGAEVRLCGEAWVVRRAFASRADDRALRGERLEDLADDAHRGSFGAFRKAIEAVAFTDAHRELLKEIEDIEVPWQYVLAWLTRDQECRLDGLTHWRHPESSSHSPVRKAAAETRLNVLRMATGLYSEQSNTARKRASAASQTASTAESAARQADERFKVLRRDLASALQRDEGDIWPPPPSSPEEALHDEQAAREAHIRKLEALVDQRLRGTAVVETTAAQKANEQALEAARAELAVVEQQITDLDDEVKRGKAQLELVSTDSAKAWADLRSAKHPTCPYDDTPLNVEKAKFVCPMPRLPDPDAARRLAQESDTHQKKVADEVISMANTLAKLKGQRAGLNTRITNLERAIEAHQLAITRATEESQAAWAAKGTLRNFVASVKALEDTRAAEKKAKDAEKSILEHKNEHLSTYSTAELTKWFDVLVKQIVANEAKGDVTLDGKGLHATIQWRGRRRSVALNSLRIVLFDLAALLCAVEGTSSAPAFLLHDSPREGDLDPWTYARLFEAVLTLGPKEEMAPFQYIVTTTTEPPGGDVRERVRVELSARSDATRFFRVDL